MLHGDESDTVESHPADRHLLFGLLALQNGLVSRENLVAAFARWTSDKSKTIDALLVDDNAINVANCELLKQLVEVHIQEHNGDPRKSLPRRCW